MAKLKTLMKVLGDVIAEGEADMSKNTPDASAMQRLSAGIAALFGRAMGADDATVSELEKAAQGAPAPAAMPAGVAEALSKASTAIDGLTAQNVELTTKLEKAQTDLKAISDREELRKFAEEVAGFKEIGLDPAKDAALLKSVEEKVGKEAADRLREVFKAQLAQKAAAGLMTEIGSSAPGRTATGAVAELEEKISDLMSKSDKFDREKATSTVYASNPGLYDRVREETNVRI